jgi:DNA-binding transcriptional ArsR family regulator
MNVVSNINFDNLIQYCIFPNSFIRNGKLPAQQKVLFEIFCTYDHLDGNGTRKGWCSPSLDKVAEQIGLSKRAVQVHLKRLVEAGMIVIVYRNNEIVPGSPKSSIYILNILPGVSEADRKRIAAARTIEIKHLISGLSTIKIQTVTGMQYISEEEFDLECIVTGQRSSTVMDGEIADPEDIISKVDENKTSTTAELNRFTGEQLKAESKVAEDDVFSFKKNTTPKRDKIGFNSEDVICRIGAGNYKGVTNKNICAYYKHLFEISYPGEKYIVDYIKETGIIGARLKTWDIDVLIPMIEFFIQRYDKLFCTTEYPRPRLYQLSIAWIINKLNEQFSRAEKAKVEMEEPIPFQTANQETRMF